MLESKSELERRIRTICRNGGNASFPFSLNPSSFLMNQSWSALLPRKNIYPIHPQELPLPLRNPKFMALIPQVSRPIMRSNLVSSELHFINRTSTSLSPPFTWWAVFWILRRCTRWTCKKAQENLEYKISIKLGPTNNFRKINETKTWNNK